MQINWIFLFFVLNHPSLHQNDFSNLIPIERAFDLDAEGVNSKMSFTLYMLKNSSSYFIPMIEHEKNEAKRDSLIKNAMNTQITNCNGFFELIDSSEMLFLKINAHLDREKQEVYNFILMVSDSHNLEEYAKIRNRNYVLIKLSVNDLNDNQPVFSETKYVFDLLETTEFDRHYALNRASFESDTAYYANLLEQTCAILKNKLNVNAIDKDHGLNSLIKYNIVQQVHRKNVNSKTTSYAQHPFNSINLKQKHHGTNQYTKMSRSHDNLDEDSLFHIDESDGSICLKACVAPVYATNLTRDKFVQLTGLLDYESYSKHILLIEARDSNPYNPLQSVVTLEINLLDLNDNPPLLISFQSEKCKKKNLFEHQLSTSAENFDISTPNVSIQYFNVDADSFSNSGNILAKDKNVSYSTVIIIDDLSEYYVSGDCIGQFLVNDLDSSRQNRRIDVKLIDAGSLTRSSDLFGVSNLKDENG